MSGMMSAGPRCSMGRCSMGLMAVLLLGVASGANTPHYRVELAVTSALPFPKVPLDPMIDFSQLIAQARAKGVLDPNSIRIHNLASGEQVSHALSDDFHYGDRGRLQWLIENPNHKRYEIRFRTTARRPPLRPRRRTPLIGVGDLLRYNAGTPRPVTLRYPSRLVDLTGDGKPDLVGTMPHVYAAGAPNGGIVCYPRVGSTDRFEFGDMVRLRYRADAQDESFHHFIGPYLAADVADVNADGLPDLLYTTTSKPPRPGPPKNRDLHRVVSVYLNSGERDAGGMPVFVASAQLPLPRDPRASDTGGYWWGPIRAVDLNQDGALDLVVGEMYTGQSVAQPSTTCHWLKNANPQGWPLELESPRAIDTGRMACFFDVDRDGRLDAVGFSRDPESPTLYRGDVVVWRRGLVGDPPRFGKVTRFPGLDLRYCQFVSSVTSGPTPGLLLGELRHHSVSFLEQRTGGTNEPEFTRRQLVSATAEITAGDQASPFPCDWEGDGDWDLVVGGGNGWPQVIINEGSNLEPSFTPPQLIQSLRKPIRVFMSQVFPGIRGYFHDMGYPFPSYLDWDGDGLPDLMMPNITNRVFWYQNLGPRERPTFGSRLQVTVDGYPETEATLSATAKLLGAGSQKWAKRMLDPNSPFGWRARAGFGDLTGDGLVDMVHADGRTRNSSGYADQYALFVRYRSTDGELRLRRDRVITLPDGSPLKGPGGITSQCFVTDWDSDGLLDLVCHWGPTNSECQPMFVRNIGTRTDPRFAEPEVLACFGEPLFGQMKHGPYWAIHDVDADGRPDLLAGGCYGNYAFYRRTALDMPARPSVELGDVRQE